MGLLEFKAIKEELFSSDLESIPALVRDGFLSFRNQVPALVFAAKDALFYGGCTATENKFCRIPFKSVSGVRVVGWRFMKCVEVEHMDVHGMKKTYFCPFTGEPHQPKIDTEKLNELHDLIRKAIE